MVERAGDPQAANGEGVSDIVVDYDAVAGYSRSSVVLPSRLLLDYIH